MTAPDQQTGSSGETLSDTYRDKIYPWVKMFFTGNDNPPGALVHQIELKDENAPINRAWLGDLSILYAVDMGDRFQILLERDLSKDITKEQLHETAVNNLLRDIEFKVRETTFGGYGLIAGGDHEAGSICLPGIWEWLGKHFNDNLIVAVPAKDLVFIVPESDADKISNLKIIVHEIFKGGERLLTRNIFKFDRTTKEWAIVDTVR